MGISLRHLLQTATQSAAGGLRGHREGVEIQRRRSAEDAIEQRRIERDALLNLLTQGQIDRNASLLAQSKKDWARESKERGAARVAQQAADRLERSYAQNRLAYADQLARREAEEYENPSLNELYVSATSEGPGRADLVMVEQIIKDAKDAHEQRQSIALKGSPTYGQGQGGPSGEIPDRVLDDILRAADRLAGDVDGTYYEDFNGAFRETVDRFARAGKLAPAQAIELSGGTGTEGAGVPAVPAAVRDYVAGQNKGPQDTAPVQKSPAEWVAEVREEHPDWTAEQIAAEARRRAGA